MTWREWIGVWAFSLIFTACVVGWVALALDRFRPPFGEILALGVPLGVLVGVGGLFMVDR